MAITTASGRRIPLAPRDGWLTLGLVGLLCLTLAWSLDDALLVIGNGALTDFLASAAIAGVLVGWVGASVGWGRWRTYGIGALFAALILPLLVGWVLIPDGAAPWVLYRASAHAAFEAWRDLVWLNRLTTPEFGHHLLVLGVIVWGTSTFVSFAAFGHRRPLSGIIVVGLLLVVNMGLTTRDQLMHVVLYSIVSLLLLIRFHTFDEQADWLRHRIGDPASIAGLYLRGGTIFIVAAVIGAMLLTKMATSAPLAGAWTDMGGRVIEWSQALERWLPVPAAGRSIGPSFGSSAPVRGVWTTNNSVALRWTSAGRSGPAELIEGEVQVGRYEPASPPYLAAAVYDVFTGDAWTFSATRPLERAAGQEILAETSDVLGADGRMAYTMTIDPELSRSLVYTPEMPFEVDSPTTVSVVGEEGWFAQLERPVSSDPYTITARVRAPEADGGVTESKLRAAGQDYPAGMLDRFGRAAVPEGTFVTPEANALLDGIIKRAGDDPYDLAAEMVRTLQDEDNFTYDVDVRDLGCGELSIVDCFARTRKGYCEYYASTMAMMLRELDIPARMVEGFLPGERDESTGEYVVRNSDAHAWVQVFFPGYGWIDFDPTGGTRAALAPLPSGKPLPSASVGPRRSVDASGFSTFVPRDIPEDEGGVVNQPGRLNVLGPAIAVAVLLAIIVAALAWAAWRRGPRGPVTADGAYGMVTRLATRLGYAPRPNQTVYEYAGLLAEVLPDARPELELVAHSKVEVAYGARHLTDERLAALRNAQRRLRTGLLRLLFHRPGRRR